MMNRNMQSVSGRRSLFVWASFCVLAGLIFLAYAFASWVAGHGEFVMPLDDVYIHFQYAKQMALGQPYVYNPGLPPTSGATSFLYPYLLAIGYLLGFQGLNLGLWAMLLGYAVLACSTWLVYRLLLVCDAPGWLSILAAIVFALSGPVSWHFMSGMETGLVVLFTLWTLYSLVQTNVRYIIIAATLLALIRPEGGVLALLAVAALWIKTRPVGARQVAPMLLPILAIGLQPLVNLLLTGSAVASGNAAKSVFGIVPFYWDEVIRHILDNWTRMWAEFLTGSSPREGTYVTPLMLAVAGIGVLVLLRNRGRRVFGLMLIGWLLAGTLAISTLDTAFWHFKRYQMPFVALLFPLAGWGIAALWNAARSQAAPDAAPQTPVWLRFLTFLTTNFRDPVVEIFIPRQRDSSPSFRPTLLLRPAVIVIMGIGFVVSLSTALAFLHHYGLNGLYVYQQPLQMARWLEANTPPDAVIAVHDVGMMRYMGGRTTLDMVGLTTPGAADYWRSGPGAVAEFLIQHRPDYIASYGHGHGFGLGMLADTSLYGEPLASFPVDLDDRYNVALAANFQGIYQPDWAKVFPRGGTFQESLSPYIDRSIVDGVNERWIDVADLQSESRNNYHWINKQQFPGFPTEVREFLYANCNVDNCRVLDGGRRINGEEAFSPGFAIDSGGRKRPLILVTRLHPANRGSYDVYINDMYLGTRWIPEMPGTWLDVPIFIPETYFTNPLNLRIVPNVPNGYYMPYLHTIYTSSDLTALTSDARVTSFQSGAIVLADVELDYQPSDSQLTLNIDWYTDGSAQGDYKVFVHILDEDDQIVAQADTYPGHGTLPPGNWLPGVLHDSIDVDLEGIPPGTYRVAIGLYDPYTFERLQPEGGDDQNRFFIGEVEIE